MSAEHLPHIEVRVEGQVVSLGDLDPHLVRKAATYRLLKHFGLSLEEIVYLADPISDRIMEAPILERRQLELQTAAWPQVTVPAETLLLPCPRVGRRDRILAHIQTHPEGTTDGELCRAVAAANLGVVRMYCLIMERQGLLARRECEDGWERNYPTSSSVSRADAVRPVDYSIDGQGYST